MTGSYELVMSPQMVDLPLDARRVYDKVLAYSQTPHSANTRNDASSDGQSTPASVSSQSQSPPRRA